MKTLTQILRATRFLSLETGFFFSLSLSLKKDSLSCGSEKQCVCLLVVVPLFFSWGQLSFMKWGGEVRTAHSPRKGGSPSKACPKSPTCFSRARKRIRKGGKMTSVTYLGTQNPFLLFYHMLIAFFFFLLLLGN